MKARIFVFLVALVLAGCGSNGGGGGGGTVDPAAVHVDCSDVFNGDRSPRCDPPPVVWLDWFLGTAHAAPDVDAGDVSRGAVQLVNSRVDVVNPLTVTRTVWIELRFDANCAGQPGEWIIMPMQSFQVVAGETFQFQVGGMCGDMPLGRRTMTATVWDTDATTVIDTAVVRFNLVP